MTVYVDDARIPACVNGIRGRWSHLISDSNDPGELAAFGRRLGLAPAWLQHPGTHREHYDLTASKRRAAIELGAVSITYPWGLAEVLAAKKEAPA